VTSVDISAEVYNFKEANKVLENQAKNCDVEKVKILKKTYLLTLYPSNFSKKNENLFGKLRLNMDYEQHIL
jgi:hypothetical protein